VGERLYFASDYFEQLYAWAEKLIARASAYVDSQDPRPRSARAAGTSTAPG
jgi:glutaminyl-tRNA synthetase